MAAYTVINTTNAQLANVNAGGTDVEAFSYKNAITLTNTELAALASTKGAVVTSDLTGVAEAEQIKRIAGIAGAYLSA